MPWGPTRARSVRLAVTRRARPAGRARPAARASAPAVLRRPAGLRFRGAGPPAVSAAGCGAGVARPAYVGDRSANASGPRRSAPGGPASISPLPADMMKFARSSAGARRWHGRNPAQRGRHDLRARRRSPRRGRASVRPGGRGDRHAGPDAAGGGRAGRQRGRVDRRAGRPVPADRGARQRPRRAAGRGRTGPPRRRPGRPGTGRADGRGGLAVGRRPVPVDAHRPGSGAQPRCGGGRPPLAGGLRVAASARL